MALPATTTAARASVPRGMRQVSAHRQGRSGRREGGGGAVGGHEAPMLEGGGSVCGSHSTNTGREGMGRERREGRGSRCASAQRNVATCVAKFGRRVPAMLASKSDNNEGTGGVVVVEEAANLAPTKVSPFWACEHVPPERDQKMKKFSTRKMPDRAKMREIVWRIIPPVGVDWPEERTRGDDPSAVLAAEAGRIGDEEASGTGTEGKEC